MNFDEILGAGADGIRDLVARRTEETPELEFKQKSNPQLLELQNDDRKALGEALSGFANAIGGTLIIGIKTERPDGVDRACAIVEIDNVQQVAERYRAYVKDCVTPPVSGLRVAAIETAPSKGVVLLDVPRGDARPHMSTAPGHRRYYRRVSDNFIPMLHYEVEEMMRLKGSPKLSLIFDYDSGGSIGGNPKSFLRFGLRNLSRVTAKYPYVGVAVGTNAPRVAAYGLDGNGNTLWKMLTASASGNRTIFAAGADMVLHPGQALFVSRLEYMRDTNERLGYWALSNLKDGDAIRMDFSFGCEDVPEECVSLELSKDQLLNHVLPDEFASN